MVLNRQIPVGKEMSSYLSDGARATISQFGDPNYTERPAKFNSLTLKRFSNECRKTKTKVITLANHKGRRQSSKPIKSIEVITRSRHKARGNVHARATIGFGFTSDWLKNWRENFEPITE